MNKINKTSKNFKMNFTKKIIYLLLFFPTIAFAQMQQADDNDNFTKTELIYGRKDGMALTMFMLTPKNNQKTKAIVSIASGNWRSGIINAERFAKRNKIYTDKGYTVFVVMHGSQPRYTIPDAVADIKRAVQFIRYNARKFNVDENHIGITGQSSGGHLALMAGLSDDTKKENAEDPVDRVSDRVQAIAVFYPPTDFLNWGQSGIDLSVLQQLLVRAGVASAFDFKVWSDSSNTYTAVTDAQKKLEISKQYSPVYSVTTDDPPVVIIHGDADKTVPLQQSEILVRKLNDVSIVNQLVIIKDAGHGWENSETDEKLFIDWFDKYLK